MVDPSLRVTFERIETEALGAVADAWRELESRAADVSYARSFDWLDAWARTYAPARLGLLRVADPDGRLEAIGLLEVTAGARLRFAGGAITPDRGPLCDERRNADAWAAIARWLSANSRRWSMLEGEGLPAAAGGLPRARLRPVPVLALDLPASFDAYLKARGSGTRRGLKQKLRRLEREGLAVRPVPDAGVGEALERFVALHGVRAATKGERHPQVDGRMATMLASLTDTPSVRLRLLELEVEGATAGVTVRLDHGRTAHFYNAGIDPEHARLSPGVVLELASIRDAIDHGIERFDLGPGAYRYKTDLGGVPTDRFSLVASSPSARGELMGLVAFGYRRSRELRVRSRVRAAWAAKRPAAPSSAP